MTNSLRMRLLWWLLVPLALYVFVTGKAEYDNARRTADLVQDNQLISSARMIAGEVEWVDGFLRVDVPPAALEVFVSPYRDQVFYSVRVDDGRLLAGTPDFPQRAAGSASSTASASVQSAAAPGKSHARRRERASAAVFRNQLWSAARREIKARWAKRSGRTRSQPAGSLRASASAASVRSTLKAHR